MAKYRFKKIEVKPAQCDSCEKEIEDGYLLIKAKVSKRSFATSRVLKIFCEKCLKRKFRGDVFA